MLLENNFWDNAEQLEAQAKKNTRAGGFSMLDWLASEHSLALLVGKEFNIRGQAVAMIARKRNESLCIVGDQPDDRMATLVTSLLSCCLQLPPSGLELFIADRGPQQTKCLRHYRNLPLKHNKPIILFAQLIQKSEQIEL